MRHGTAIAAMAVMLSLVAVLAMPLDQSEADDGSSLANQIANATDGTEVTIELTEDVDLSTSLEFQSGQNIVLDLNDHAITISERSYAISVPDGVTLTLKNGTLTGTFTGTTALIQVSNGGTLSIEGMTVGGSSSYALRVMSSGTMSMTDSTVSNTGNYAVYTMGTTTIYGGTVNSGNTTGVYYYRGTLTIDGNAMIERISPNGNDVTINSGTIGSVVGSFGDGSTLNATFVSNINGHLPSNLVSVFDESSMTWSAVGMTEDNAPAMLVSSDGKTTYYGSLHSAASAAGGGDTIVLLEDCISDMSVTVKAFHVYIDLNGYDIVNTSTSSTARGLYINASGVSFSEDEASESVVIKSSVDTQSSISAVTPIYLSSGNSNYFIQLKIECDLSLEPSDGNNGVELSTGARIVYSEEALSLITEGGFLVTIDGTEYIYGSAGNALNASDDGYAKLLNDYSGVISLNPPDGEAWTLDLNGKTVTASGTLGAVCVMTGNCSVTVQNGTLVSTNGNDGILVAIGGEDVVYDDVVFTLDGVTLDADGYYGIVTNGRSSGIEMTLTGCSIEAGGMGIYFPSDGSLVLEDTEITAPNGVQFCGSGSLTVVDCTITATLAYQEDGPTKDPEDDDGAIADGAAISIVSRGGDYQADGETMTLTISGGTYTSNNSPIQSYRFLKVSSEWVSGDDTDLQSYVGSVTITGGTFVSESIDCDSVSAEDGDKDAYSIYGGTFESGVDDDLLAEGYELNDYNEVVLEDENAVAKVGDAQFGSLQEAINYALGGQTVTLLDDVILNGSNVRIEDAGIILDLGGHTITIRGTGDSNVGIYFGSGSSELINGTIVDERVAPEGGSVFAVYVVGDGVSLTTSDISIQSTNSPNSGGYGVGIFVYGGASLILDSGTSISPADDGDDIGTVGVMIQGTKGLSGIDTYLTVKEGVEIEATSFAISGNGSSGYADTSIDIEGGTITSTGAQGIYHPQTGTLTVTGGTITGTTGIEMRSGTLTVTGGTITGTGNPFSSSGNSGGSTTSGAGIAIVQHTTRNDIGVTVSGGSVSGYYAIYEANQQSSSDEDLKRISLSITGGEFEAINGGTEAVHVEDLNEIGRFISGGEFSSDVSEYCKDGFTAGFSDGTWSVGVAVTVSFVIDGEESSVEFVAGAVLDEEDFPTVVERTGYTYEWQYSDGAAYNNEPISEATTLSLVWILKAPEVTVSVTGSLYEDGQVTVAVSATHELDSVTFEYYLVNEETGEAIEMDSQVFAVTEPGTYSVLVLAINGDDRSEYSSDSFEVVYSEPETTPPSFIPVPDDDDDVYVPPTVVVNEEDDGSDVTGVVAVAAAAVAVAIIALFLAFDRKRE